MKINLCFTEQFFLQKNYILKLKKIFVLFLFFIIQGCTSGVEVAANLGKKYLIPKEKQNIAAKPIYKIGNKYNVKGKFYFPKKNLSYNKTGIASWYGPKFHGKLTANGEIYNQYALTAAHKTLPLPSIARVTNLSNGRVLLVRVNDRGPFVNERIIDLSRRSAQLLGIYRKGTGKVKVEFIEFASLGNSASIDSAYGSLKDTTNTITKINKKIISDKTISSDKLFIQLGAFSNKENAIKLAGKLETFGSSKITKININGRELHRLRIGPLSSKSEADIILTRLHNNGYPGAKLHSNK